MSALPTFTRRAPIAPVFATALQEELRAIRAAENEKIRALLTPDQRTTFETVLVQRKATRGSSRHDRPS